MATHHEEPTAHRMELLGHLAAAARLALAESPDSDGVELTVTVNREAFAVDCSLSVQGVPVSGWGQ